MTTLKALDALYKQFLIFRFYYFFVKFIYFVSLLTISYIWRKSSYKALLNFKKMS